MRNFFLGDVARIDPCPLLAPQNRFMHSLITFTMHHDTFLSDPELEQQQTLAGCKTGVGAAAHGANGFSLATRRVCEKGEEFRSVV